MKDDHLLFDLVENWLNNNLEEEEKKEFEIRLKSDSVFSEKVSLIKDMILSIEYESENKIRKTLTKTESNLKKNNFFEKNKTDITMENNNKGNMKLWIGIAASLLIIVAIVFNLNSDKGEMKDVFAKYNVPEKTILPGILDRLEASGLADNDKKAKDSLAQALTLFENYKYKEAKTALYKYLEVHPEDKTAQLYMGLSLFSMEKYGKATEYLMPLVNDNEFAFLNTAKWYLALSYTQFKTKETKQKAIELMKELASVNSEYQGEANDYLQYLQ